MRGRVDADVGGEQRRLEIVERLVVELAAAEDAGQRPGELVARQRRARPSAARSTSGFRRGPRRVASPDASGGASAGLRLKRSNIGSAGARWTRAGKAGILPSAADRRLPCTRAAEKRPARPHHRRAPPRPRRALSRRAGAAPDAGPRARDAVQLAGPGPRRAAGRWTCSPAAARCRSKRCRAAPPRGRGRPRTPR